MEDYFKQRFRLKNRSHLVEAKLLFTSENIKHTLE